MERIHSLAFVKERSEGYLSTFTISDSVVEKQRGIMNPIGPNEKGSFQNLSYGNPLWIF